MITKVFGVILITVSCGGVGFQIAANHLREEKALRQLIDIINFMECELKFRLTPLPELCKKIAMEFHNSIGTVFYHFAQELDRQESQNLTDCLDITIRQAGVVPSAAREKLIILTKNLGKFDLEGQLKGLAFVREECKRELMSFTDNKENRLRSYQTLGLCAGAALAILFV